MKVITRILIASAAVIAAVSCARIDEPSSPSAPASSVVLGAEVTAVLPLNVSGTVSFSSGEFSGTRAPQAADGMDETVVSNVWVFQFGSASSDDERKLVCPPYYIDEDAIAEARADWEDKGRITRYPHIPIPLIESAAGEVHLIAFIANVGDYSWGMSSVTGEENSYRDLKSIYQTVFSEDVTYGGSDMNLIMSGSVKSRVVPEVVLDQTPNTDNDQEGVALTRSLARVQLDLSVDPATDIRVISVQMRNVSNRVDMFDALKAADSDPYPVAVAGSDYTSIYPAVPSLIDYDKIEDTTDGLVNPGDAARTFTWYVPRNTRGQSASPSSHTKNSFAPIGATYIEIVAVDRADNDAGLIYRVYPGANDINDHTLIPNHEYRVGLTIDGDGSDPLNDSRIERYGRVRFDGNNNSFILNPPMYEAIGARTFEVPITQVNRYWRPAWPGYGGLGHDAIGPNDRWQVDLLWQDASDMVRATSDTPTRIWLSKSTGIGDETFDITVPYGARHGNFVVALRKIDTVIGTADGQDVLWSWHFWVTDYNPDEGLNSPIHGHQFAYSVSGGQIERYGGTQWGYSGTASDNWNNYTYTVTEPTTAAPYAKSFMMDRPIGSIDRQSFRMQHQWGRKDPTPQNITLYNINGTALSGAAPADFPQQKWVGSNANQTIPPTDVKITYSVTNPLVFYGGGGGVYAGFDWGRMNDDTSIWYDILLNKNDSNAENLANQTGRWGKSIFDPCPPGWKVPPVNTMQDFVQYKTFNNSDRGLPNGSAPELGITASGLKYWPYLERDGSYPTDGVVFYLNVTRRMGTGGFAGYIINWGSMPSSTVYATGTWYHNGVLYGWESANNYKSKGESGLVRCISM